MFLPFLRSNSHSNSDRATGKRLVAGLCVGVVFIIFALGVMGRNGWLPRTDALSGKKTGWFGKEL
ncbi:MAG TPA: hypothetical protein PKC65_16030, partial [Pyrinomonadaceae bacterium]|nr:hypothetical protein [Pyrinomonadaceae bacterium]